jgi:hypothetical protein
MHCVWGLRNTTRRTERNGVIAVHNTIVQECSVLVAACRLRRRSVLHLDFEAERMAFRAERGLIPELQAQK